MDKEQAKEKAAEWLAEGKELVDKTTEALGKATERVVEAGKGLKDEAGELWDKAVAKEKELEGKVGDAVHTVRNDVADISRRADELREGKKEGS